MKSYSDQIPQPENFTKLFIPVHAAIQRVNTKVCLLFIVHTFELAGIAAIIYKLYA